MKQMLVHTTTASSANYFVRREEARRVESKSNVERGFTLIELMFAVGLFGIVSTLTMTMMVGQQQMLSEQMENSVVQQNGRAAIALMTRFIKKAGYGYRAQIDMTGLMPIDPCHGAGTHGATGACDGGTAASDTLTINFIKEDAAFSEGKGNTTNIEVYPNNVVPGTLPSTGDVVITTGTCAGIGSRGALLELVSAATATGAPLSDPQQNYDLNAALLVEPGWTGAPVWGGDTRCDLGAAMRDATFGLARQVHFWIKNPGSTDAALPPTLMMSLLRGENGAVPVELEVAYDIDDLQVQVGIDVDTPPSGVVGNWCDDYTDVNTCSYVGAPDAPYPQGGNESSVITVDGFTADERLARIIAVRIAVVPRTSKYNNKRLWSAQQVHVQNRSYANFSGDGYRRWIYRATVAMRNNIQ